jgi:2-desacetyl-2-hydroxyethyl bacteriochlorophyllide A dehydrogenase
MKGKRLLFPEIRRVIWETVDLPEEPEPYSVVAKTLTSLISVGTELAIYTGSHIGFTLPNPPFPMMPNSPGYALVGKVTAVGREVTDIQPGQRVMMEVPHGTVGVAEVGKVGIVALSENLSDAQGALVRMAEVALAAVRLAPVQLGDAVVIYGLGLVGQLVAQLFSLNGAHPVIGIDRLPARLEVARSNGVTALNADEIDVVAEVARLTGGRGPDVVIEATGSPTVVALSLELVAKGGRVVLLGSTRGRVELDPYSHIHRKGVRVIGAHESAQFLDHAPQRWNQARNLQLLAELFAAGKLRSQELITHTINPDKALTIYDELAAHPQDYLGVLIDWRSG